MKILIITTQIPFPPHRGDKLKIFNIYNELSKKNQVKVLTFLRNNSELPYITELKRLGFDIDTVKHSRMALRRNSLRSLLSLVPFQVACFHSTKMKKLIKNIISKNEYDVIYFHLINTAHYIEAVKGINALRVIDLTDSMSLYTQRYLEFEKNIFRKLLYMIELKKLIIYEKRIQEFDDVFICSEKDKEILEKKNYNNVHLLMNGFNLNSLQQKEVEYEHGRIIFSGFIPYLPNRDAIQYFANEVFPLLLKEVPYAKFYIVGKDPTPEILALKSKNVIVTGFVSDITKEYLLSEVNIAPLRIGAGTANKIIESLALGVPTVATSRSVEGFPSELKKFIFIADTPQEFVEQIKLIFSDHGIRNGLMVEAKEKVTELLSWEKIVNDFENYLLEKIQWKSLKKLVGA